MKNISILGSTGSIGKQTLDIISQHPDKFNVVALAVNTNIELLKEQIKQFNPLMVSVFNKEKAEELRNKVDIEVFDGLEGLNKLAVMEESDTIVTSVVGAVGLIPTLKAIDAKKNVALANKETLVTAGDIVMKRAKENNVTIMPIDSEHSALFQCLNGEDITKVNKIIVTCSGGSFRGKKIDDLKDVTVREALNHPTWTMGQKITIDSASLMNKGFEVIEAHHLYNMPYDQIQVLVHPQSIIHSMVEFIDGSIIAQIGCHDMRIPIQYALSYPERIPNNVPKFQFDQSFTFEKADTETFRCLEYAYEAGRLGGTMSAVLNAANEVAVARFLKGEIKFLKIQEMIKQTMGAHNHIKEPDINDIIEADRWAREFSGKIQ